MKEVSVKITGDLFDTMSPFEATVPLPTEVMKVQVYGKFSQRERKMFAFLLHAAWENLKTTRVTRIKISEINRMLKECTGSTGNDWVPALLEGLAKIRIKYQSSEGRGWGSLLSWVHIDEKDRDYVEYEIPKGLDRLLLNPTQFGRIRTHFLLGLNGKYSVSLYQFLETKINMYQPTFECSLEELRDWLSITKDEYQLWGHLESRVLRLAVDEINNNPFSGKFTIKYETIRGKRNKVTHVKFILEKDERRNALDLMLKQKSKSESPNQKQNHDPKHYKMTTPFTAEEKTKINKSLCSAFNVQSTNKLPLDAMVILNEWRDFAEKKKEKLINPVGAFIAFYKNKTKELGYNFANKNK